MPWLIVVSEAKSPKLTKAFQCLGHLREVAAARS